MARVLQLRRGTTAENNLFTGAVAEATYDTDRKELRVHDGSTVGGKVVSAPTAAVMAFAGSSAPEGWLVSDGSAVSRTTYSDLFDAIGTTYGAGDGSTTFNLPDLSGKMPLYNSAATLGDTTAGKVPNITGGFYVDGNNGPSNFSGPFYSGDGIYSYRNSNSGHATIAKIMFDANKVSAVYDNGATGITPAGVYTLWCIKY